MTIKLQDKRSLVIQYLKEAIDLDFDEELYIPAESRNDQMHLLRTVIQEIRILERIDPVTASSLIVHGAFKSHRLWVVLKKVSASPTTAFRKGRDGEVERVTFEFDSERSRRLRLMIQDGLSVEQIQEIEGELSPDELIILKQKEKDHE
jgi:hypothetical protein